MSQSVSGSRSTRPVEVVCHRGASNRAPDNTFASAREALALGADYIELDVNLSADGVHYVFHGPGLEGTTDGEGLFHQLTAAEIDQLDAGSWFDPAFAGERVPRLEQMLAVLQGKTKIFFDVKRANLPELLALVERYGFGDACFFWFGFDEDAQKFRDLSATLPLKINVRTAADIYRAKKQFDASIVEVFPRHLSQGMIGACRDLDIRLMINYMGKDPAVFAELTRWPIDMINLDYMDLWLEAQASARPVDDRGKAPVAGAPTRRVVLFMLDGCRPDAIAQAHTPNIDRLVARGSHTWQARTVMPSISLPCHTALFYSQDPSRHGVVQNRWERPPAPAISIGEVIQVAGHDVAMFYTWEELRDLSGPGTGLISFQQRLSREGLAAVGKVAAETIAAYKPTFSFVYLEATDAFGHLFGWMSPEYLEAVSYSDMLLGEVIRHLEEGDDAAEMVFVVLADHGGHERGHGTDQDADMLIPLVLAGPGVGQGREIGQAVSITDVAPTLLALLGLPAPAAWDGTVVAEAVEPVAQPHS